MIQELFDMIERGILPIDFNSIDGDRTIQTLRKIYSICSEIVDSNPPMPIHLIEIDETILDRQLKNRWLIRNWPLSSPSSKIAFALLK